MIILEKCLKLILNLTFLNLLLATHIYILSMPALSLVLEQALEFRSRFC